MSPTLLRKLLLEHRYAGMRNCATPGRRIDGAIYPRDFYRPAELAWQGRAYLFTYDSVGATR